ncbi:hypothetical protein PanWU01x14_041120, partial [Parasponia andersonii]
ALEDALSSTAHTSPTLGASKEATGVCLTGGEGILVVAEVESRSLDADDTQGEGSATKFELEALFLENLAAVQSFYSSHVGDLTGQLNIRVAMAERSEVTLAVLRADFDLYRSLDEARVNSAVAHALSIERARPEELVTKLAEAEGEVLSLHSETEAARLAQAELKVKEQELQTAKSEMWLAFIARDRAVDEAKESRKVETKAKLEAYSLQGRLDRSNERQVELRLAALKDRLADAEKLKMRYQRQVDILSTESYRSG